MKYEAATILLAFTGIAAAAPVLEAYSGVAARRGTLRGREVPQEHSHNAIVATTRELLFKNNPQGFKDPIFGLLGDTAAAAGLGKATDPKCLQMLVADQAFTNAKAAGDIPGMTGAMIFRCLERNTGKVGLASAPCTSVQAVNPEIAALSQHQDPASPGAAATNKAIVLQLAKQIASVGGNPLDALQSGTFAPGDLSDTTAKGNSCDVQDDQVGCIFTEKLIVNDTTADEIINAVSGTTSETPKTNVSDTLSSPPSSTSGGSCPVSTSTPPSSVKVATSSLNFGSCTNPSIIFAFGLDGRNQDSFEPANKKDFVHGSALAIGPITSFICDRFQSPCHADAKAIQACAAASAAASKASGQAAADAWNSALGLSASTPVTSPQTVQSSTSTTPNAGTTPTGAVNKAATTPKHDANSVNPTQSSVPGINVQKFAGTLGGPAPAVIFTPGVARPFTVSGNTFVGKGAALQRSCSEQHNNCADDANSGKLPGGVGQCDAQQTACNDASTPVTPSQTVQSSTSTTPNAGTTPTGAVNKAATTPKHDANSVNPTQSSVPGTNVQKFTGTLGGPAPAVIFTPGVARPFTVSGNTFVGKSAALQRSCSEQHNNCADDANSGKLPGGVGQCDAQQTACNNADNAG